ncbi:MAG: 30S ribosomal protein S1, partial [Gammaproteobacteria bacterium]|nr:30S ribosomal protein S1 [Gammaproteobacteria bacterium]
MSENFAELFQESLSELNLKPGSLIKATVIDITAEHVVVDAGLKSEDYISIKEFNKNAEGKVDIAVGDEVDVVLEMLENGIGETHLSREKARLEESWQNLETALNDGLNVVGVISGRVKGGFTVELDRVRAFLPASLIDVRPVRDMSYLEGKELEFKLINLDRKRNNIVVSRRAVLSEEGSEGREAVLANLQEGQEVIGIVKNLTDYGAFVDLGGVDGLLHITDMSWKRIKHPGELITVGDEIKVKVLKFDNDKNRVSLGMKQLGEDPWAGIERRYPVNARLFGKVTNLTDYGCFVEIENGIEGLVHVSEMDWTNKNVHPAKIVSIGDEVEVMVLEIDEERRRISLGMKQCQTNPWQVFADTHQKGEAVKGNIKSITDFGVFIGLDGSIDGLVHLSDISWVESGERAIRNYKKGQEVDAVILAIDPERERISLGIKQLEEDSYADYFATHPKGTVVTGKVTDINPKGVTIDLGNEIEGKLRVADISKT